MFDLAASTPPSAQPFSQLIPLGIAPETAADTGDTPQTGAFEALLALQTASPVAAIIANPPGTAIRQPDGKILPEAAMPVAAESSVADELTAIPDEPQTPSSPGLPDPALIAAIFAAPQRLASSESAPEPTDRASDASAAAQAKPLETRSVQPPLPTPANAAAITVAQAAVIELEPATPVPASAPAVKAATHATTASQIAARPIAPTRGKAATPEAPADHPVTLAKADPDPTQQLEAIAEPAASLFLNTAPANPQQDNAPAARAEPRAERIDFATLVETLSRAREEASPNTVRASINHAEFGRVSLRFEQDDKGALQVAMSSADPGFARAVTASNEAASTQTQPDTQRGQTSHNAASNGGESAHQQPGQRPAIPGQPAPQLRDKPRGDSPQATDDGIFA